jgi:acetyltransferase
MLFKQDRRRYRGSIDKMSATFKTRSGQKLRMRLLQPTDAPQLLDLFRRLSPETRRRRFHANVDSLSGEVLAAAALELADVDNRTAQGAVVATVRNANGDEEFVGVARLARPLNELGSPVADAAIVVRDDFQGQGVGSELLRRMVLLAKQMRLRTIRAVFTSYNEGAIHLFRNLRLPYTIDIDHGETEMQLEVPQ